MTIQTEAIYEHGIFRPAGPVELEKGAHVILTVDTEKTTASSQRLADALLEIAAMPVQSADDGFSGTDHDRILYGK